MTDTYASTVRCPSCRILHAIHLRCLTCQRCGSALPIQERGCERDRHGVGACRQHPNGCPRTD